MKFGGTSVGSAESIRAIRAIVADRIEQKPVVVVSAVGGVTNLLVELVDNPSACETIKSKHQQLIDDLWPDDNQPVSDYCAETVDTIFAESDALDPAARADRLLSIGETVSSYIVSQFLSESFDAQQIESRALLITNDTFGSAEIINDLTTKSVRTILDPILASGIVPVVTGFIGATADGKVTTLGRGGSDYSAALLGYYLQAKEIQIWTDVDGVYSTDPRMVDSAQLIEEITYQEASELAAFGAKVLHPKTMRPAVHGDIPLRIANTFRPDAKTTSIVPRLERHGEVIAVVAKKQVMMVNIYAVEMLLERGFLARISSVFERFNISVDIVSASETSVSVTLDNHERLNEVLTELEKFSSVTLHDEVGLVSLIGQGIANSPSALSQVFDTLAQENITVEMVSVGAQSINVSLVIHKNQVAEAVSALHRICIEEYES